MKLKHKIKNNLDPSDLKNYCSVTNIHVSSSSKQVLCGLEFHMYHHNLSSDFQPVCLPHCKCKTINDILVALEDGKVLF